MATYTVTAVQRVPAQSAAPALNELGPLFASVEYSDILNEAGTASLRMDVNSLQDDIKEALRDLAAKPLEAHIHRDGQLVFAGPIVAGEVENDSVITLTARGVEFYLAYMLITDDDDRTAVDQYTIAKDWIDDWQALDYGDYGIDTSNITTHGTTRDHFVPGAMEPVSVYEELRQFSNVDDGFDWYVNSDREMVFVAARGSDLSTDVFLERGVSSPKIQFAVSPDVLASEMYATGTNSGTGAITDTKSNTTLRTSFGRAGATVSIDGADTAALLSDANQYHLDIRDGVYFVPGPQIFPVSGSDVDDFNVGDTVTYTFDAGLGQQSNPYRIRKRTIKVADNGQEMMTVEFF